MSWSFGSTPAIAAGLLQHGKEPWGQGTIKTSISSHYVSSSK